MLIGRALERQALDDVLAAASRGESAVCVLVGEAGIGKTALLGYAADRADGMQPLTARGVESEAHVPFGGLLELLRPALGLLDRIPEPQAAALAGALALRAGGARDRFTVGAATLSLLAAAAEQQPLVVLVDDAQWLDGASAEALLFALRRLLADPIAVVLTVRDGESSLFDGAGLPTLRLAGLDRDDAAALLTHRAGVPVDDDVAERLYRTTGGNPLALLELGADPARLEGGLVDAPLPVATSVAQTYGRRAAALPPATRGVLLVAATSGGGSLLTVAAAASALGLDVADLAPAEDAGLVAVREGRLEFRHPLVRSAIYAAASAQERRDAHRALAATLPDRDADRRAWHLASAAIGPDEAACAALAQAGARARERSAPRVAAAAFERAASLSPSAAERARLLHAAADAAWVGGLADRAVALLEEAGHDADDELRLSIDHLRGHVAVRRGRLREGHRILVDVAARAAERDPERAVVLLAEASNACYYSGDVPRMLEAGERAQALVAAGADGPEAVAFAALAHGMARVFAGDGAAGAESIRHGVALLEASDRPPAHPILLAWGAMGPLWLREGDAGRGLVTRALDAARDEGALGALPFLLLHVARDHATSDRWTVAAAEFHEGIAVARETGQQTDLAILLAGLAGLEARQGREAECRRHAVEARALSTQVGGGIHDVWALGAIGVLELGLGHAAEAASALEELDALLEARGIGDVDLSPAPELVEAYLRLGRADAAAAAAAGYEARARAKGQPWALARSARCAGLLAADDAIDGCFAEALELHARTPDAFEAACTRLAHGARLRRARRRTDARVELRRALDEFDRLGAVPWSELAGAELAATGETARRREPASRDRLTPQELQIALLLADGRTTREAAAAMFLSPKTVEYHLRNVYRKLDVRSREGLAAAMAAGQD